MTMHLRDLIHEFAPDAVPAALADDAPQEPLAAIDGAAALAVVTFLDAVTAVVDLLDEETAAIIGGDFSRIDDFTRRKHDLIDRLRKVTADIGAEQVTLSRDLRELTLERVQHLQKSIEHNASSLAAVRSACVSINRALLTSLEQAVGEGLYGRGGIGVRPLELSIANLNTEL